jgi:hypothetical protein
VGIVVDEMAVGEASLSALRHSRQHHCTKDAYTYFIHLPLTLYLQSWLSKLSLINSSISSPNHTNSKTKQKKALNKI